MTTTVFKASVCVMACVLAGCTQDTRPEMREAFPEARTRILTDSDGRKYAVTHHLGNVYRIDPVD